MDYAPSGAVVNVTLWPDFPDQPDFVHQSALFLSQNNSLGSDTTLYAVFFGINDFGLSLVDGDNLPQSAPDLIALIQVLATAPTNAKNILVLDDYGRGTHTPTGDAWKQAVFDGLSTLPTASQTNLSGECSTPLNSFYWLPGHPSKETHRIMADYVDFVLANC